MSAETGDLARLSIGDRKRQAGRKLLPARNRGLIQEVKSKAPNRTIRLQTSTEPTHAEVAQGTAGQHQAAGSRESDVAAIEHECKSGIHREGDSYV